MDKEKEEEEKKREEIAPVCGDLMENFRLKRCWRVYDENRIRRRWAETYGVHYTPTPMAAPTLDPNLSEEEAEVVAKEREEEFKEAAGKLYRDGLVSGGLRNDMQQFIVTGEKEPWEKECFSIGNELLACASLRLCHPRMKAGTMGCFKSYPDNLGYVSCLTVKDPESHVCRANIGFLLEDAIDRARTGDDTEVDMPPLPSTV